MGHCECGSEHHSMAAKLAELDSKLDDLALAVARLEERSRSGRFADLVAAGVGGCVGAVGAFLTTLKLRA
jgi:hypothetical protein